MQYVNERQRISNYANFSTTPNECNISANHRNVFYRKIICDTISLGSVEYLTVVVDKEQDQKLPIMF